MNWRKSCGFSGNQALTHVVPGDAETRFQAIENRENAGYWVDFCLDAPAEDTYIMIPACAYDGNRFMTVRRKYPPMYLESELGVNIPIRMTQVPALSRDGDSWMDVTTGDMAVPCVCVLRRSEKRGFMVFFNQGQHGLNHGVALEQAGSSLTIRLRAPALRRLVYRWYDGYPSLRENAAADPSLYVRAGDETVICHRIFEFDCRDIPELFRAFFKKRAELYAGSPHANLPFSQYWTLYENDQNETHYDASEDYFALTTPNIRAVSKFGNWQTGWVGGGMLTLALLCEGNSLSRERAINTLRFAARHQSRVGWYYGIAAYGKVYHDCFGHYEGKYNMILVRKHADLTYFMFKQLALMRTMGISAPEEVTRSAIMAADALENVWERYGQIGQFVNAETGEIVAGGSTSGAMAPGALAVASMFTGNGIYLRCAREMGEFFYRTAILEGVTIGGPGEILQAPDSESVGGLLESYIALYEADGSDKWLQYARDAAHQLSSWVVAYDYQFPPQSRFGRMGIRAAGSVWANVQNKHSAPGICTASGVSLMKLYRATGDALYMDLLQSIAHFLPQVVSYQERPMYTIRGDALRPGEMCERVNLSDWEGMENVGDSISGANVWPSSTFALTWTEIPGIYVDLSHGLIWVSDHVNARLDGNTLLIDNPTSFPAVVKVLAETESERREMLGLCWQDKFIRVDVPAKEHVGICL